MASPPMGTEQKGSYYGQGQQLAQQGIPMQGVQQQQQQSQYHVATPLQNLTEAAAPVDCPACRARALTRTEYVSGNTTMLVPSSFTRPSYLPRVVRRECEKFGC